MSKYTTEVRFICESYSGLKESGNYDNIDKIIEGSLDKIFDFDFPLFDENYRKVLETKIIRHYYTREIGLETASLWKHFLKTRLNEIMPYYNQLYESETLKFNPLYDFDYTLNSNRNTDTTQKTNNENTRTDNTKETNNNSQTRTDKLNSDRSTMVTREDNLSSAKTMGNLRPDNLKHTDTTTTDTNHTDAYSDTPQAGLANVDNLAYLTNYRHVNDSTNENNNGTNTGTVSDQGSEQVHNTGSQKTITDDSVQNTGTQTFKTDNERLNTGTTTMNENGNKNIKNLDDYLEHVAGKRNSMTYSQMLMEYRQTFINIDVQIINELADLFLNLW